MILFDGLLLFLIVVVGVVCAENGSAQEGLRGDYSEHGEGGGSSGNGF